MQEGDYGIFVTVLGFDIEGEIIGEMANLYKVKTTAGFIRIINKSEILRFVPKGKCDSI